MRGLPRPLLPIVFGVVDIFRHIAQAFLALVRVIELQLLNFFFGQTIFIKVVIYVPKYLIRVKLLIHQHAGNHLLNSIKQLYIISLQRMPVS